MELDLHRVPWRELCCGVSSPPAPQTMQQLGWIGGCEGAQNPLQLLGCRIELAWGHFGRSAHCAGGCLRMQDKPGHIRTRWFCGMFVPCERRLRMGTTVGGLQVVACLGQGGGDQEYPSTRSCQEGGQNTIRGPAAASGKTCRGLAGDVVAVLCQKAPMSKASMSVGLVPMLALVQVCHSCLFGGLGCVWMCVSCTRLVRTSTCMQSAGSQQLCGFQQVGQAARGAGGMLAITVALLPAHAVWLPCPE